MENLKKFLFRSFCTENLQSEVFVYLAYGSDTTFLRFPPIWEDTHSVLPPTRAVSCAEFGLAMVSLACLHLLQLLQ